VQVETAEFVLSAVDAENLIFDERPQVAFVGRSNVGKSSLLNKLLRRKALARISSTPGRTRAINYFLLNDRVYFVDLPGYGYARVAKSERRAWAELMADYLRRAANRAMVIQIIDAKVGATELDVQAHDYLRSLGHEPLVVATKVDRLPRGKAGRATAAIRQSLAEDRPVHVTAVSARTGTGIGELWTEIDRFITGERQGATRGNER
jgi:GTP-binding protein